MSKKDEKLMLLKRYVYFTLMILSAILCISVMFFELFILTGVFFVLEFVFIFLFANSFKFNYKKNDVKGINLLIKHSICQYSITLKEVAELYKYNGLDILNKPILKLFFNKDYTKRCVIFKESNAVKLIYQQLYFYDDESKLIFQSYANWIILDDKNNYYDNIETALSNHSTELKDYSEDNFTITPRNYFYAEINWQHIDISNFEILPFGIPISATLHINNKVIDNVLIYNYNWYTKNYSSAKIHYPKDITLDFNKSFKFYITINNNLKFKGNFYKDK